MAKGKKLEALLASLDQIKSDLTTETAWAQLQQILNSPYGMAVARVAKLVERAEISSLLPDLEKAFDRFLEDPVEQDPSCLAKTAIAEAFYHLEYNQADPFLKGIRHRQLEPVYGGRMDTAPQLRTTCALGLVRMNYPEVFVELADLLADPEAAARIGAARAVAYTGDRDRGLPLLRLRALCGDQPEVMVECVNGLLQLDPHHSLGLVSRCLESNPPVTQELIALSLGESHLAEALQVLKQWWQQLRDPQLRGTGLLAIAMIRSEEAFAFLLQLISKGSKADAQAAIEALRTYRQDQSLWQQVMERAEARGLSLGRAESAEA